MLCVANHHYPLQSEGNDDLQQTVDKVYTTGNRFGLEVSRTMTEVQCIGREKQQTKTSLGGTEFTQCEEFVYLGGVVSGDGLCDRDVDRIGLAVGIVRNLHNIWKAKDISKSTKVLLYQSMVQSIVLYNSETWTEDQKRKLKTFEMAVLRKICGITRRDRRRNVDILKEFQTEKDINEVLQTRRLTYFGHVTRMEKDRYPNILIHGYTHGRRPRGRPRKRWLQHYRRLWRAELNYSSGVTSRKRQSEMEKYCPQQGLPERGDIVFVAEALSQVS